MRKKNCKGLIRAVVLVLVCVIVFSVNISANELKIKTLASHRISVQVLESGQIYNLLESFPYKETGSGELTYQIQTAVKKIDLKITITYGSVTTLFQKLTDLNNTKPIMIRFFPGDVKIEEETPVVNTTNVTAPVETAADIGAVNQTVPETEPADIGKIGNSSRITGFSISKITNPVKNLFSMKVIYYILGIVLIGGGVFFIVKMIITNRGPGELRIRPYSKNDHYVVKDKQLLDAERKIRQAQEELEAIKQRKNRLSEVEARYEAAKRELDRARRQEGY